MKLKGPILFFPVAFALCCGMFSAYRFFSIPDFSEQDVLPVKGIVLQVEEEKFEAAVYQSTDTLTYYGPWLEKKPEQGQEITLYKIKDESKYVFQSKEAFGQLTRSKTKAKWIMWFSLILFGAGIFMLYSSSKKKKNG